MLASHFLDVSSALNSHIVITQHIKSHMRFGELYKLLHALLIHISYTVNTRYTATRYTDTFAHRQQNLGNRNSYTKSPLSRVSTRRARARVL